MTDVTEFSEIPSPLGPKISGHIVLYNGRTVPGLTGRKIGGGYFLDGNGAFMEEETLCFPAPTTADDKDEARIAIDEAMIAEKQTVRR